jgi:hypothetical protein
MRVAFAICCCLAFAASAAAQDDRNVGLTIGYPSAVGVIWQAADRVAIRADTFFSSSWTGTDASNAGDAVLRLVGTTSSTSGRTFGVGVSVLVTVATWERLRAYLAPRAAYARSSNESEISFSASLPGIPIVIQPATFETKVTTQTYSGSFGTQYGLGERFAAFGEVGVAYASSQPSTGGAVRFGSAGSTSPIFNLPGVTTSISSSIPRPRTNTLGIRSGVGIIFFF